MEIWYKKGTINSQIADKWSCINKTQLTNQIHEYFGCDSNTLIYELRLSNKDGISMTSEKIEIHALVLMWH